MVNPDTSTATNPLNKNDGAEEQCLEKRVYYKIISGENIQTRFLSSVLTF